MTLRTKITLSLLTMSFAAIAVVGLTARASMTRKFDSVVVDRASVGFLHEIEGYYRAHGSWEAAAADETFFEFLRRAGPPGVRRAASRSDARREAGGASPRPRDAFPRPSEFGGPMPRFAVTNAAGFAQIPLGNLEVGQQVSAELLALARPIVIDGATVGYAVPLERPVLTQMETQYLAAVNEAWFISTLLALLVALPLGLYLASRLTRPLREMSNAMAAMSAGSLRQVVGSYSDDEVGELAANFNRMSMQLADAYDELQASHVALDAQARKMTELSRRDHLTGLLNRRGFHELVGRLAAQARRYDRPMSVAVLDLDHFKAINDTFSHAVGDRVLERASRILVNSLRETDVVARYGGEEFVIAFPETKLAHARGLAERIRLAFVAARWDELNPGLTVTVSTGLVEMETGESLREALERADRHLYSAKDDGRNQISA